MARPVGVTIVAIVNFLSAVGGPLLALRLITRTDLVGGFRSEDYEGSATMAMFILDMITFPVLYALAGRGLWKLKNWGRVLTVGLTAHAAALEFLRVYLTLHPKMSTYVSTALSLAINGMIAWYLLKADVKAAFAPQMGPVASEA